MNKFDSIIKRITQIHFIEMSLACQLVTVISIYVLIFTFNLLSKDYFIGILSWMLLMSAAPISFIFGLLGIIFDKHKLLAIVTTCVAGIPTFFVIYSYIDILRRR